MSLNCWHNGPTVNFTQRIIWQFNTVMSSSLFCSGGKSGWVYSSRQPNVPLLQGDLKGSVGVWLKLASAKMAKVPTVVKTTKIQRNMRSTTMATYCQSSFSWTRTDGWMRGRGEEEGEDGK